MQCFYIVFKFVNIKHLAQKKGCKLLFLPVWVEDKKPNIDQLQIKTHLCTLTVLKTLEKILSFVKMF